MCRMNKNERNFYSVLFVKRLLQRDLNGERYFGLYCRGFSVKNTNLLDLKCYFNELPRTDYIYGIYDLPEFYPLSASYYSVNELLLFYTKKHFFSL